MNRRILKTLFLLLLLPSQITADSGYSKDKFSVISSFALSGINYDMGQKIVNGATMYFDYFNANSKIKIDYKYFDDGFRRLKFKKNILNVTNMDAVFMPTGTENIRQIVPQILSDDIIIFAPFSGANFLNFEVFSSVINTAPSLDIEMENIVKYFLDDRKLSKISLLYQSGEHGEEAYNSLEKALNLRGYSISYSGWHKRNSIDTKYLIENLLKTNPDVIVIAAPTSISAKIIKEIKAKNKGVKFVTINVINIDDIVQKLENDLENIYFSTFTPSFCDKSELANLYLDLSNKRHLKPSLISYNAFLNAFLLAKTFEKSKFITIKKSFIVKAKEVVNEYKFFANHRVIVAKNYLLNLKKMGAK